MKLVIQRVDKAQVKVSGKIISSIKKGIVVLVGFSKNFEDKKINWTVKKILNLRLWESDKKGFDLSIKDIKGEILIISQFTLFGNCKDGNKPNFADAMDYETANKNYDKLINKLKENTDLNVQSGKFGAKMELELINNGPVTVILEK